jgi:hypothetical protein
MVAKVKAGQPPSIKQTLKVLPNPFLGISGGYTANVLWLLNVKDETWESALPKDTKKMLEDYRRGRGIGAKKDAVSTLYASLKDFPYITTFAMDYSPELTQMMSQMASYTVMQSGKDIKAMVAAAAAKVQQQQGAAKPSVPAAAAGTGTTGKTTTATAAKPAVAPAAAAAAAAAAVKSAVAPAAAAEQPAATAPPQAAVKPAVAGAAAAAAALPARVGSNSTRS